MIERESLKLPVVLGVLMIVTIVALSVGWVLLSVFGAERHRDLAPLYWTLLPVGAAFLAFVLVGVVTYLWLSVKIIRLNHRQSNFVDSVTHELKSPITSLKLYLQTLRQRPVSEQERAEFYDVMLNDVERLHQLILHILDAAHLEKEAPGGEEEVIDLAPLLRECAAKVCEGNHVELGVIRFSLHSTYVLARRVDVEIVFRNLVDNAVKYGGEDLEIEISLAQQGGEAVVKIADNGPGIPAKQRRKVFRRFARLGVELERERAGTGLGLYIVRNLVRRMRGKVSVYDPPHGSGTIFEVRLPALLTKSDPTPLSDRQMSSVYPLPAEVA